MNKRRQLILLGTTVILLGLSLVFFRAYQQTPPVHLRGVIQSISTNANGVSALIQTPEGIEVADYDYAQVLISNDIVITLEQTPVMASQLEAGMLVEVSFTGAVAESYPVQAVAASVTIIQTDYLK